MNKKKIKELVLASYKIDEEKIKKIAPLLNRSDLKKYIGGLKTMESKKNVIVTTPFTNVKQEMLENLFPNKRIVYKKDPSLIVGLKIQDDDIVYDFNLKNTLNNLISYIKQDYE